MKSWLDAARNGHADELAALLASEPSLLHFRGVGLRQTALHWACTKDHAAITRWLLSKGAPFELPNANGARPPPLPEPGDFEAFADDARTAQLR